MGTNAIRPACKCTAKLRAVHAGQSATFHAKRTCPTCKARWQVVVRPNLLAGNVAAQNDGSRAHLVELTCLRAAQPR